MCRYMNGNPRSRGSNPLTRVVRAAMSMFCAAALATTLAISEQASSAVRVMCASAAPGTFIAPRVPAEGMYDPGVNGRTAATRLTAKTASR